MRDLEGRRGDRGTSLIAIGAAGLLGAFVFWSRCPPWLAMWVSATGLYGIAKWLTWRPMRRLNIPGRYAVAYLFAWPGLDPQEFVNPHAPPMRPRKAEWVFAAAKLLMGLLLLRLAISMATARYNVLAGWLGLAAIAFLLHFGSFHLLSCLWRRHGFGAVPVMDWPILATSLSDFWGRRWNRPVNDGTYRVIFRPLSRTLGVRISSLVAFLFSGLLHEVLITVPAHANWGFPTSYFLIQGLALQVERSQWGRRLGLGDRWKGWLVTAIVVALPVGLLFPRSFLSEVIVPFLNRLNRMA